MPSVIEPECPWYYGETLAIENEREMVEPFVAQEDDHEWNLLRAYDSLRAEIVAERRPLSNQLARRRILEQAVALAIQFRGVPILAGTLFAYSDGVGVEVVRAPSCQSPMARQNPGKPKAKVEPKPPRPKPAPPAIYEPPDRIEPGDYRGTLRMLEGRPVWSISTLAAVMGIRALGPAMVRARGLAPLADHSTLFPSIRTRDARGKIAPVAAVTPDGLPFVVKVIPKGHPAVAEATAFLESFRP